MPNLCADAFESLCCVQLRGKEQMKCVMQRCKCLTRITTTPHAHFIQAVAARVIADREGKGQGVFHHDRVAADVSLAADAAELVHTGVSADVCFVLNDDMSG